MPAVVYDRVKETTTTTGTGNITLAGAATNFRTFTSVYATNEVFPYAIVDDTNNAWEAGYGYLSGTTTLVRDRVTASTNSNAAVNFSAGTKSVFVSANAEFLSCPSIGQVTATSLGYNLP
jgi:hypothetical protein